MLRPTHQTVSSVKAGIPRPASRPRGWSSHRSGRRAVQRPSPLRLADHRGVSAHAPNRLDDDRRQDLYADAATVVVTRARAGVERARARRWLGRTAELTGNRVSRAAVRQNGCVYAGRRAATATCAAIDDNRHRAALAFLDELIAVGDERGAPDRTEVHPAPPSAAARDGEEAGPR